MRCVQVFFMATPVLSSSVGADLVMGSVLDTQVGEQVALAGWMT